MVALAPTTCAGCPTLLPPKHGPGARRKWCSDRCRKGTLYGQTCVDCGAPTSGSDGRVETPRCAACGAVAAGAERKVWTQWAIIVAIRAWEAEHGSPPSTVDWDHWQLRNKPTRAKVYAQWLAAGRCPSASAVFRAFGSFNAGIRAAGFKPRPQGEQRRA